MIHHNVPSNFFLQNWRKNKWFLIKTNRVVDVKFSIFHICVELYVTNTSIQWSRLIKISYWKYPKYHITHCSCILKKSMPSHQVLHHWFALKINAKVWSKYMFLCCQGYCPSDGILEIACFQMGSITHSVVDMLCKISCEASTTLNPSHLD